MIDLSSHIEVIARRVLGTPNATLSTGKQLRFGRNGSIAVDIAGDKAGSWFDHETNDGGGALQLIEIKGGVANGAVVDWLRGELGIEAEPAGSGKHPGRIVAAYDYRDESGRTLFQVCRYQPKDFRQRRPDGRGGWAWSTKGIRKVPYKLPEMLAAAIGRAVFVVEGEKDVNRLVGLGLVATCNPGGAAKRGADGKPAKPKWPRDFRQYFSGRKSVVVLPDNDDAGRDHARAIAANLGPAVGAVRIVSLPGLPPKGDVSNWLDAGHTRAELEQLVGATEPFVAEDARPREAEASGVEDEDEDARPPEFSDEALALRFSERHAGGARYVAAWGKWLLWDGSRWVFDETMRAFDLSRAVCRAASAEIDDQVRLAAAVASAKAVAATVSLARADRRHAATIEQWDTGDGLNTPGGIVDLSTGTMTPHDPARYLTKITAVAPGGACPLWLKFLNEITAGDAELQAYLQRVAGYCLTGDTSEHALFFGWGTGRNGKGVFLNTLTRIWGDYAAVAPMTTFTVSHNEQHPTDLAGLRGARLVTAQETEEGRRWAEAKIKQLTGGDPIRVRFMRQDFWEYTPQFKLFVAGNHKPALRGVDVAIRARMNLVPFTVTIPEAQADLKLPEKLKAEWPGILQRAIDGHLEWRRVGLAPPAAVRNATDEYLASEDAVSIWLAECCCRDKTYQTGSADLFASWKEWADRAGEFIGSQKRFTQALEDRGLKRFHDSRSRRSMFRGIALLPSSTGTGASGWSRDD